MPKKRTPQPQPGGLPPLKVQGKTFTFAHRLRYNPGATFPELIEAEGGTVAKELTPAVDFLVVAERSPRGQWAAVKKAEQLNTKRATTEVQEQFCKLLARTREEGLALLRGGAEGIRRWNFLRGDPEKAWLRGIPMPALGGANFREVALPGVLLLRVRPHGADFRGADLTGAS